MRSTSSPRRAAARGRVARRATVLVAVVGALLGTGAPAASADPYRGPDGASRQVVGAILDHYRTLPRGAWGIGGPLTEELGTPAVYGRYQLFERASIYWSPASGAWSVQGAIRDTWGRLGWESGPNGFPTSDERNVPVGVGKYNLFQNGAIYWRPASGAHSVQGLIWQEWGELGWENSFLGFPTTDELGTPHRFGRFNHFVNGSIYWSPATGAHAVGGIIRPVWESLGWEDSELGFPVSDEYRTADGGVAQDFEGGTLAYDPSVGDVVVLD